MDEMRTWLDTLGLGEFYMPLIREGVRGKQVCHKTPSFLWKGNDYGDRAPVAQRVRRI